MTLATATAAMVATSVLIKGVSDADVSSDSVGSSAKKFNKMEVCSFIAQLGVPCG